MDRPIPLGGIGRGVPLCTEPAAVYEWRRMRDARGLDLTADDPAAVAAADDFTARLLRLDRGVEAIVDAAKRWPKTPIIQLYAATFWLYGQTDGAREAAGAHLRACKAL